MTVKRETINILGVNIDNQTMNEAVERVAAFLEGDRLYCIYTPNAEIIMEATRNREFHEILEAGDMVTADGAGVVLAARMLNLPIKEKVSGLDLIARMFSDLPDINPSGRKELKVFIFGAKPGVADMAAKNIESKYTGVRVVGTHSGYGYDDREVIYRINESGAEVLLVALGVPRQEKWIHSYRDELKAKVCVGCGGSVDIFAGTVKKAPEFLRRNGLEWLYRLAMEPYRIKRQLDLPRFMMKTIRYKLFGAGTAE